MKKGTATVLGMLIGAAAGSAGMGYLGNKQVTQKAEKVDKFKGYYNMLNQWLMLKQDGKNLSAYFKANDYRTIAIYGMGEMGNRLYDELKGTDIEIKYAVDKNAASTYSELDVVDPDDCRFEDVDCIVVTATFAFDEIAEKLEKEVSFPIVSLEDVVYEV
ncbi:MAG: hypothetical protein J6Y57_11625 [Lachnospiraceae bacterium]|nr:hypothetical protein [Lachnospiraceae bacterium]